MQPLLHTDTRIGSTSLMSRCISCDRPVWGTEPHTKKSPPLHIAENSKEGAFQGSLLIGSPTRPSSQRSTLSPSSFVSSPRQSNSRGGGFRVNTSRSRGSGAQNLWVGGDDSPTGIKGIQERPHGSQIALASEILSGDELPQARPVVSAVDAPDAIGAPVGNARRRRQARDQDGID